MLGRELSARKDDQINTIVVGEVNAERDIDKENERERAMSSIVVCRSIFYRMEAKVVCGCNNGGNFLSDH